MIVKLVRQSGFPLDRKDAVSWSAAFSDKVNELVPKVEGWYAQDPKKAERRLAKRLRVFESRLRRSYIMEGSVDLADDRSLADTIETYGEFALSKSGTKDTDIVAVILDIKQDAA